MRKTIEVQPLTVEERQWEVVVDRWRKKLLSLAWKMEGQLKWGKNPREVSMSKRRIYRALNGGHNRKAFDDIWRFSAIYFQEVWVERGRRVFKEYLPVGTVKPKLGYTRAYLFRIQKLGKSPKNTKEISI